MLHLGESSGGGGVSIHAPREGSDIPAEVADQIDSVSIHAPREGSDS